jgi:hypothetical protein
MSVYTLDIDSSERNPILYPDPGDYVVELKNPIYDVKKLSIISGRIHASQLLINDSNNTFSITTNGLTSNVTLTNGNYSGKTLAIELADKLSSVITSAVYDKEKNDITLTGSEDFTFNFYDGVNGYYSNSPAMGKTTPHDVLGLPANNISSTDKTLTTGSLNLQGPDALVIKISSGAEELNKTVYSDTPFYTGRILMCGDVVNYSGQDDIIEHNFDSGSQNISKLRIQFYYSSNNRLIPYDFRNANHILKLNMTCTIDKLKTIPIVKKDFSLPKPIQIPDIEDLNKWNAFLYIFLIVITGMFFIMLTKPRRISE